MLLLFNILLYEFGAAFPPVQAFVSLKLTHKKTSEHHLLLLFSSLFSHNVLPNGQLLRIGLHR